MKIKFLFMLLSVLFMIPMNAATDKKGRRKSHIRHQAIQKELVCRTPLEYNMTVRDEENTLIILFEYSLNNADINITDKDGNIVINESKFLINETKMLYINTPTAYPYFIKITSPTIDIIGEITQEEI